MSSPRRFNIVGTSGSGKSTLARAVAARLNIPLVELDALHWEANWTEASIAVFRQRLTDNIVGDAWVVDGNYAARAHELIWPRVEVVVWLDLPLHTVMAQVASRTFRRVVTREELWSGNRERLSTTFTRESILWWAFSTFGRRRREYRAIWANPPYPHIAFVQLRSRRAVRAWLESLTRRTTGD